MSSTMASPVTFEQISSAVCCSCVWGLCCRPHLVPFKGLTRSMLGVNQVAFKGLTWLHLRVMLQTTPRCIQVFRSMFTPAGRTTLGEDLRGVF